MGGAVRSGIDDLIATEGTANAGAVQAERPLARDTPDSTWLYSSGATAINARILGDLVGTGDDFESWVRAELFDPIGLGQVDLSSDGDGYWMGGFGSAMTVLDFARFGLLYMRDGVWDGERILPPGWVDYGRTNHEPLVGYGAGFWVGYNGESGFSAEGLNGQNIFINPELDLIVVTVSNNPDGTIVDNWAYSVIDLFRQS